MKKINKISIHCWGGLGSQLCAWAMAEQVSIKFPNKSVRLVLHTDGVTKRKSEINFLSSRFKLVIKDDYQTKSLLQGMLQQQKPNLTSFSKTLLSRAGVIYFADRLTHLNEIKTWTLSLRSHYSNIPISRKIVKILIKEIAIKVKGGSNLLKEPNNSLGVHFRAGDLLVQKDKFIIEPKIFQKAVQKLVNLYGIDSIHFYSDDIPFAKKIMKNSFAFDVTFFDTEIWETIIDLCKCKYFIGTNSKITIWIIIFRNTRDIESWNFVPRSMKTILESMFPDIKDAENTHYY